ncbi:MAG: twin-arginine translocase subunit TatC [Fimbriimonadaceae bacterium]|nr:twin-arginine translocase subunit TatC [Fimbriimonadaceae bacterium]QYK56597.1 MAG: twin-arginine translocase subunit TatC [Fimbriimonadaceae bacterium]
MWPYIFSGFRRRVEDPEEFRATLGEHLEEFRTRVLRVLGVFVVAATIGWFIEMPLYKLLNETARAGLPSTLDYKEPFNTITQPFLLQLKLAAYIGLAMSLPYAVYELWGFVSPGLKPSERRPVKFLAPFSASLFFVGCYLGWLSIPAAFGWFAGFFESFPGTSLYQEPGSLVFLVVKIVLSFGIGFQLPVVTFLLAKLGLITPNMIAQYWRQAVVTIFFLAAAITPTGDPFTMLIMALPLTILFFGSLMVVKLTTKQELRDPALDSLD